jgi:hypothetical protein
MEFTPPSVEAPITDGELVAHLTWMARSNGLFPEYFEDLVLTDLARGPISLSVMVRPLDNGVAPILSDVYGIPATRMSEGRQWLDSGTVWASTGCLPLGVQIGDIPDPEDPTPFQVPFGMATNAATVVLWAGGSAPIEHIRFLGFTVGGAPEGITPPEVALGDPVGLLNATPADILALQSRFNGRLAVIPLLSGANIVQFARVRLLGIVSTIGGLELRMRMAPSAVVRGAIPQPLPITGPPPVLADVPEIGVALRPWRAL